MTTLENEQENPLLFLDCLYCQETCWDDDDDDDHDDYEHHDHHNDEDGFGSSCLSLCCEEDEEEQLNALFLKEEKAFLSEGGVFVDDDESLMLARREALDWMIRANSHHNFAANTLLLGVTYFDRFILSFGFQRERPWMIHVVAVACLSLASKIEETYVPLLLDFQVEHKLMFEAKVIQRMELLVLSTLGWNMNAVTPLSYFGHLIRKLKLNTHFHWDILCRCESLISSAILDTRFLYYVPSVLAAATMVQTLKEIGLWDTLEHHIDIMDTFKLDKEKVEECYNFIQELASNNEKEHKRKRCNSASRSPNNVLDVVCNESSANNEDSSSAAAEPLPKKCRTVGPPCFG